MSIRIRNINDDVNYAVTRHGDGDDDVILAKGRRGLLQAFQQVVIDNDDAQYYTDLSREVTEVSLTLVDGKITDLLERKQDLRGELDALIEVGMTRGEAYGTLARQLEEAEDREAVARRKREGLTADLQMRSILDRLVAKDVDVDDSIPKDLLDGARAIIPQRDDYTYGNFARWFLTQREGYEYENVSVVVPRHAFI